MEPWGQRIKHEMVMKPAVGLGVGAAAAAGLAVVMVILLSGSHQASGHVVQLAECANPQRASCGRLVVGQRNVGGVVFTEGAVTELRLTDARGGAITLQGPSGGEALAHSSLPAGRYTLDAVLRPCDANCSHLDPPIRCTAAPLKIVARQTTTATVVVERNARCRIMAPVPLRTFSGGGMRFRYPASWRVYRWNEFSTMSSLIVDLSNQPERPPCTTHRGTHNATIRCRQPLDRLTPNSVLAEWSSNAQPGFQLAATPGTPTRIGGRSARLQMTNDNCQIGAVRSLTAVIAVPGGNSYIEFRACLSGPDPSLQEQRARTLLATVRWR